MKQRLIIGTLAMLLCFGALAACGPVGSDTTTDYQTTTTTTTTTAAAEMTQTHNRAVCIGLLNIGACNTVQVNTQTQTIHKTPGVPAPASSGMSGAEMIGTLVLLCIAFVFCMCGAFLVMGKAGM